jgi:hypothetical protein
MIQAAQICQVYSNRFLLVNTLVSSLVKEGDSLVTCVTDTRCHPTTMGCLPSKDREIRALTERIRALEEENARLLASDPAQASRPTVAAAFNLADDDGVTPSPNGVEAAREEPPGERCGSIGIDPLGFLLGARPVSNWGNDPSDDSGGVNVDDASAPNRYCQSNGTPVVSRGPAEGEEDTGDANEDGGFQKSISGSNEHTKELDANVIAILDERRKFETKLFPDGGESETLDTALSGHVDECTELRQAIVELTKRNQELEADVASLANEKATLASMLALEKRKLTKRTKEATERRKKFESKLANMSDRLNGVLDDDLDDDVETSFESKADGDTATH